MTAPPPKIKAYLGVLKDKYLDALDAPLSPAETFEGLVKAELVLRGLLTPDDSKLWQQVQSSIGKPLLDESDVPKPLLAGANVVAGRLAEALAKSAETIKCSVDQSILKRAKDILDHRWILLLQQDASYLEISRGYFCRAASIQSETPPMWKKVWDAWTLQSGVGDSAAIFTPFEAQLPLEQLIRIASSKGNLKRTSELQIRLICSYLNTDRIECTSAQIGKQDIVVAEAFGDNLTSNLPTNVGAAAERAQQIVDDISVEDLSEEDQRLLPVLRARIGLALEDAKIEAMAEQQHQTNQNRSLSSSMKTCRIKARSKLYLEESDLMMEDGKHLRNSVASLWSQEEKNNSYWGPSLETLGQCIERLMARAVVKIQKDPSEVVGWRMLLDYMLPLLTSIQAQCRWSAGRDRTERMQNLLEWVSSAIAAEQRTISRIGLSATKSYWMLLAKGLDQSVDDMLKFLLDLLSALIHQGTAEGSQAPTAVRAEKRQSSLSRQWKLSRSTVVCGIAQHNQRVIDQVSRDAIGTKKQEDPALGNLQCMVAWSGWFQPPWSYCSNLSDVRRILTAAHLPGERYLGEIENMFLNLARADAELLNGGFPKVSQTLYSQVLEIIDSTDTVEESSRRILRAHCYNGLAQAYHVVCYTSSVLEVQDCARKTLGLLDGLQVPEDVKPLHIWHRQEVFHSAISYQRSLARQLIADSLISEGKIEDARSFLEAAVQDAPLDAGAALSFGAFLLRVAFYMGEERSTDKIKAAQVQLLKAAKLDASKANPFALLGIWFEECGDPDRALGCFAKSLALDASNPIAGRGLLRVKTRESIVEELDRAIDFNSPLNGWAWRAIGMNKIFLEAEDDFAVVALLKALRSRDVASPMNELLGIFYNSPSTDYINERADALAELGMCYRRLGRFTASIRAFQAAIDSAGEHIASSVLCSCAQVELELSLFDDAAEKFGRVLLREQGSTHSIAAYGQGVALLRIAQRDLEDGKAGSAFAHIQNAVQSCESFSSSFGCTRKLLGDLYSFGAVLPPDLLNDSSTADVESILEKQLEFVRKGESAYRTMTETFQDCSSTRASTICDVGSNILLQAQLQESVAQDVPGVLDQYDRAQQEFQTALDIEPLHAPAWCGLGCCVITKDPLLAQHAFARCLQIENMFPDAYANVGFLYTSKKAFGPSESVMNSLTQVADTPMMWMNRAFILERSASALLNKDGTKAASDLSQASDAYRAAMQVMKHPESQLGLAMTGRIDKTNYGKGASLLGPQMRKDSLAFTKEYNGGSIRLRGVGSMLQGIMTLEQTAVANESWFEDGLRQGESLISLARAGEGCEANLSLRAIDFPTEANANENGDDSKESSLEFPTSISLQRRILHEPNRADLWLELSKELLRSGNGSPSSVSSAGHAAFRAASMLTDELIQPRHVQGKAFSTVDAQLLSEALALGYWLGSRVSSVKEETSKGDGAIKTSARHSPLAFQRALMMDPTNPIAREAMNLSQ